MSDVKRWEEEGQWVEIDLDLCTGEAECVDVCPADVYVLTGDKVSADTIAECVECGACEDICPNDAILSHWAWG